jgi:WD40 repeat protein
MLRELGPNADRRAFAPFDLSYSEVARAIRNSADPAPPYFAGDPGSAAGVAFSADGQRLISPKPTGELLVWDVKLQALLQTLPAHSQPIVCFEASRNGRRFLTGSRDGSALVWDSAELTILARLDLELPPRVAAWSPDGAKVVIACGENEVTQVVEWDVDGDRHVVEPLQLQQGIGDLSFASDSHWLITPATPALGDTQQLAFWNRTLATVDRPVQMFRRFLTASELSEDGSKLVVAGVEHSPTGGRPVPLPEIALVETNSGKLLQLMQWAPGEITDLAFLSDGVRLAGICANGSVFVWNSSSATLEGCIRTRVQGLKALVVAPGESHLAALDPFGRIQVWPLRDRQLGWSIESPLLDTNLSFGIRDFTFTEAGRNLLVESASGGVSKWSVPDGCKRALHYFALGKMTEFGCICPGGKRMISVFLAEGNHRVARAIDLETGTVGEPLDIGNRNVLAAAASPDGRFVAIGDNGGSIQLFDAQSLETIPWGRLGEPVGYAPNPAVTQIAFAADSQSLAASYSDGTIKWWDLPAKPGPDTKPPISRFTFSGPGGAVGSLAISPDGRLVAASTAYTVVYDAENGLPLFQVPGFKATFSPDGAQLCTNGGSRSFWDAAIWETRVGKQVKRLEGGHSYAIFKVAYSPDGRMILTGDQSGAVRAWNAATGEEWMEFPELDTKE